MNDADEELEQILNLLQKILDEVTEDREPSLEISGVTLKGAGTGAASKKAGRIIKESKNGGVEIGKVEAITGKSEKPAMRIMRAMGEEFDYLEFKKGDNNRPSKLFHKDDLPGR